MSTKYIVNNASGQTINGQSLLPSYKVYTALLTQSGGDDPLTTTGGTLTIGVTYEITNIQTGDDFTNVGASSNTNGVKFVATGTTPTIWTNSSELSYNNGAPVVTVLENSIGNICWSYASTGNYMGILLNAFTSNKTAVFISGQGIGAGFGVVTTAFSLGINQVDVMTQNTDGGINDYLINTPIEIRVYN